MANAVSLGRTNWLDVNRNSSLTDGLCILIGPAGEAVTRTPFRLGDVNDVSKSVSTNPGGPIRHFNYGHPASATIPVVTGGASFTGGPPRLLTTLALQTQWRKITGDFTYLYLGYGTNVTFGGSYWSLVNQFIAANGTQYAAQDYVPYSSYAGIREVCLGGTGTGDNAGTFSGLRVRFTNPAAGAPLILVRQGGNAYVYVSQAQFVTYSATVTGSISWGTYSSKTVPCLDTTDFNDAEFCCGGFNTYDPYDTGPDFSTFGLGVVAFWNRALSTSERIAAYSDPAALFAPPRTPAWGDIASTSGGGGGPVSRTPMLTMLGVG